MMWNKSRSVLSRLSKLGSYRSSQLPPPPLKPTILLRRLFFSESGHIKRPPPPSGPRRHPRTQRLSAPWHDDPRKVTMAMALASGCAYAAARVRYGETEPFTGRTHLALLSHKEAREHDEAEFAKFKEDNAYLILDPNHADTVRVRRINDAIVRAAHRGVALRQAREAGASSRITDGLHWMDGLEWEVIVIGYLNPNAMCFPGAGKIVVHAGLLDYFKTDAEIAYTIAHEVGHVIGRHSSGVFNWLGPILEKMPIFILFLLPFLLLQSRRHELEADQIGMMLLAAAGVDPIIAVLVEEKFAKITGKQRFFLSTHPCSKKRSQFLSRPKIMGDAVELYKQVVSHR